MRTSVLQEARAFYLAKGFSGVPQVLVNGVQLSLQDQDIESAIVTRLQYQTFEIQQAVFNVGFLCRHADVDGMGVCPIGY